MLQLYEKAGTDQERERVMMGFKGCPDKDVFDMIMQYILSVCFVYKYSYCFVHISLNLTQIILINTNTLLNISKYLSKKNIFIVINISGQCEGQHEMSRHRVPGICEQPSTKLGVAICKGELPDVS